MRFCLEAVELLVVLAKAVLRSELDSTESVIYAWVCRMRVCVLEHRTKSRPDGVGVLTDVYQLTCVCVCVCVSPQGGGWAPDFTADEMTPGRLQVCVRAWVACVACFCLTFARVVERGWASSSWGVIKMSN